MDPILDDRTLSDTGMAPPDNPQLSTAQEDDNLDPALHESQQIPPASEDALFVPEEPSMDAHAAMVEQQRKLAMQFRMRFPPPKSRAPAAQQEATASVFNTSGPADESGIPTTGKGKRDPAVTQFAKLKATHTRKQRAGTLSFDENVAFLRAQAEEEARLRKREADEAFERELTPGGSSDYDDDIPDPLAVDHDTTTYSSMFADDSDGGDAPTKKRKSAAKDCNPAPKKRGRKAAGSAFDEPDDVLKRAQARAARGKKAGAAKTKGQSKRGANTTNLDSIMGTNIFEDTAQTRGLRAPPTFGDQVPTRRANALQALIASVPVEDRKIASSDKRALDAAIRDFTGQASVKPAPDGNFSVKGMRATLKPYQVIGTAFMRRRENASDKPLGGIIADAMGLGKTVMMLANIVSTIGDLQSSSEQSSSEACADDFQVNGRPRGKAKCRATLIVASPALVSQWYQEILRHTIPKRENRQHGMGRVLRHHAGYRVNSNDALELLGSADIVLTTYHEVCRSYPKAVIPPHLTTAAQKDVFWKEKYERDRGDLHRIKWLRVVLDEAQAIKNHLGHTSMACRALEVKHPWLVTGTPLQNSVKELYAYFRFLKQADIGSYRLFCANFCSPDDPDGTRKLAVFLNKIMIRRTHLDTLFNARLLDLPQPTEHTLWLEFSDVERQIYEIVKRRFVERINTIARQGHLEKQFNHIWTMILRLRQICAHILLIQSTIQDLLTREDFEKLNSITCANEDEFSDDGALVLIHLRAILKKHKGARTVEGGLQGAVIGETETVPMDVLYAENEDPSGLVGGKHGQSFRFRKYMRSLEAPEQWGAIKERSTCAGCRQAPEDAQLTSCNHIYCKKCLQDLQHHAARRGHDQARCAECGEAYTSTKPCQDFTTAQQRDSTGNGSSMPSASPPKKGKDDELEDWINMRGEVLPSAKTMAAKAQILNWMEEAPDAKIIVFTQFLPMVRIVSKMCNTEGWGWLKYTGEMSHDAKEKAISAFEQDDSKKILIASLRSGGLGLNLTMARFVLCLGLVVKNTIDAAMVAMKERKQVEIDEIMEDPKRNERPTSAQLMKLFGPVGEEDGHPFIFPNGEDEDNAHLRVPNVDKEDETRELGNEE
ncbi:hypothetical protein LTS14_001809 [Recurvomyces mirabilis]|uniref:uncharacterized protein n=1 Tax=Recurvomyces mirabilis TaxID=574656 RepID=UPI002DDFFA84|nr:hypothetical protein LTS14_001809 [Recurvomyces mirabilis]